MLKSIVVALDGSQSSANARRLALEVAQRTGADLVGVGVLDVPWITAPRATPIGAGYHQFHRNEELLKQGRAKLVDRIEAFHKECAVVGVGCSAIGSEGDPVQQIDAEADRHDLIIIGRETNFHGGVEHDVGECVEKLCSDTPRPLIIAPEGDSLPGDPNIVVVAFDGSVTASRAMHMYLLLGLADGREIHVVAVDADGAKARGQADRAAALFRSHGVKVETNRIVDDGRTSSAILGAVSAANAGRLVMGAFGHGDKLRRLFMGSTTKRLLHESPVPIFIHH